MSEKKDKKKFRIGDFLKKIGPVGGKILSTVGTITGVPGLKEIGKLIDNDPELTPEQKAEARHILDQDFEREKLYLADKSDSRDMYTDDNGSKEQVNKLSDSIMKWNLWAICGLVLVNIALILGAEKLELPAVVIVPTANIIGMVMMALMKERDQVVGFFFGSSIGSKNKDKKLNK